MSKISSECVMDRRNVREFQWEIYAKASAINARRIARQILDSMGLGERDIRIPTHNVRMIDSRAFDPNWVHAGKFKWLVNHIDTAVFGFTLGLNNRSKSLTLASQQSYYWT